MALGERHTCALLRDGVRCWGENDSGQLGDEDRLAAYTPSDLVPLGSPVHGLTGGKNHTCALGSSGVVCWGDNTTGQVSGIPTVGALPPTVVFQDSAVLIGARAQTSCVAASGPNTIGQIGNGVAWSWGSLPFAAEGAGVGPVKLVGFPGFAAMTAGDQFLCMLTALGVECIGEPGTAMDLLNMAKAYIMVLPTGADISDLDWGIPGTPVGVATDYVITWSNVDFEAGSEAAKLYGNVKTGYNLMRVTPAETWLAAHPEPPNCSGSVTLDPNDPSDYDPSDADESDAEYITMQDCLDALAEYDHFGTFDSLTPAEGGFSNEVTIDLRDYSDVALGGAPFPNIH